MAEDPYQPPESRVADTDTPPPGSIIKAVLLGLATDIGGTILFSITVGVVIAAMGGDLSVLTESDPLRWMMTLVGGGFTVLGGYVAARIANRIELNVSLIFGVCTLVAGLWLASLTEDPQTQQTADQTLMTFATIPAALLGGWLRKRNKRRAAL
jgi:hypothetical protein